MRGSDNQTSSLFSYVSCEARVPASHPLRRIRAVVDEALRVLSPDFDGMYAQAGRPSIAPEKLLRRCCCRRSIRSSPSASLCSSSTTTCWSAGLWACRWTRRCGMPARFSKNRERFLDGDVAQRLLTAIIAQPRVQALMSDEHVSVDGTLIQLGRNCPRFRLR